LIQIPRNQVRRLITLALLLLVAFGLGCASKGKKSAGDNGRPKRTVLLTSGDDVEIGREAAASVEAQIGLLDDPELLAYIDEIGKKLLRGLPRREFAYHFSIVDQMEPNAFALPGGHIFISRGLLALANSEDELANVIGHEIIHAARRHSAQRQAIERYQGGALSLPRSRAQMLAAYGRDMEREADELGQQLAAAAGYDPMGMSTFMRRLDQRERLLIGAPRAPTFFDSHPGSRERASVNAMRSRELRWIPDPTLGDTRARLLDEIDGMVIGDRPETGVFIAELFLHPGLGFEIRFPKGWNVQNSSQTVGAQTRRGDAVVYLTTDQPAGDLVTLADEFAKKLYEEAGINVTKKERVKLGTIDAVRYTMSGGGMRSISARITFFPFANSTWRIVGVSPSAAANRYLPQILLSTRSFGPISQAHLAKIRVDRLHVVLARSGEDLQTLGQRTGNAWAPSVTGLINGLLGNEVFKGGELMKNLRSESMTDG
jgi:predicted Zn-dependent protease